MLGVKVDKALSFKQNVENLCKNAGSKLTALARLVRILSMEKKKILMTTFIEAKFSHCPLVWMYCHCRKLNNRINLIHERGHKMVYEDYISTFEELLQKDGMESVLK